MTPDGNPKVILQIRTVLPSSLPDCDLLPDKLAEALRVVLSNIPVDLPSDNLELGITLTDDPGIRAINKAHQGIDSPTDVLSFPLLGPDPHPPDVPISLGDIGSASIQFPDRRLNAVFLSTSASRSALSTAFCTS